jgi:RNA polymerase sigma-70 factor, ECF subfamily
MAAGTALLVPSDEQLLRRAVQGDREALEDLFRRYRLIAYRVAYRLLGNEADALDAVQEAFVKALTHLPGFQGRSTFKTWLLRVVSNASLDFGRQRGRREALSFDAMAPQHREGLEPLVEPDPGAGLQRDDLRRALQQALEQLPPAQRQTFVLHTEAELSYREVADVLGISIGTVMSRLYYARQKLRVLLEVWMRPA